MPANPLKTDLRGGNTAPPEARRYVVKGRVQGVGYRWYVEREANQLGLRGWVRNNLDGAVEVLAIGGREQLATLRRKLEEGPRASRVDTVEELPAQASPDIKTFRIEGAW